MVILACMSLKDKIDSTSVFWRKPRSIDHSFSYRPDSGQAKSRFYSKASLVGNSVDHHELL